ncbi:MAG: sensor histidine kinase [Bacteroidia bacterium]
MDAIRDAFYLKPIPVLNSFHDFRMGRNLRIVFWVCVGIVVLTTGLLLSMDIYNALNGNWEKEPLYKTIAILRLILLLSLSFTLWPQRNRNWDQAPTEKDKRLIWLLIGYILVWCIVTSIIGSAVHGQIIIFIVAVFAGGTVLIIRPIEAVWVFGLSFIALAAGLIWAVDFRDNTIGNLVGATTVSVISFFISVYNYRNAASSYNDRQTVIRQKKNLEILNKDIALLLEQREEELGEFIYRSSHDLRAPVVELQGLWEIFRQEEGLNELHQTYINAGAEHTRSLDTYVRNLIGMMENRRKAVEHNSIDLQALISRTRGRLIFLDDEIQPAIHVNPPAEEKSIQGDEFRLWLILSNLLENAIRFQRPDEPDPYIHINWASDADGYAITIEDNGAGMSAEQRKNIMKRFVRGKAGNVGAGLGLFVVKEIVDKLGGEIGIASEENKGSRFTLTFPHQSKPEQYGPALISQ